MKAAKPFDLSALTTDDLVARFTAAALAQYHARMDFDIKTITPEFEGQSPRDYLSGRNWDVRTQVGLEALRQNGVLKR